MTAAHSLLRVPHDTTRWVAVQQDGHVVAFADTPAVTTTSNVLDISDRVVFRNVHGLLGLAFHPNYPTDPRACVAYTHETSPDVIVLRISEFTTADGGATLNPASEQIVFEMAQPGGHNNGGHLLFGPDGFLYLGIGDGGNDDSASGVAGNGQLTNNLLGKILRIDVSGTHRIAALPHSGGQPVRRESAVQYRWHRDPGLPGDLRLGIPQSVALVVRPPGRAAVAGGRGLALARGSGSRGARRQLRLALLEGTLQTALNCGTPTTPLLPPVAEYDHPTGQCGRRRVRVSRHRHPGAGRPLRVRRLQLRAASGTSRPTRHRRSRCWPPMAGSPGLNPASFAQDNDGELFIVDVRTASIYKLVPG